MKYYTKQWYENRCKKVEINDEYLVKNRKNYLNNELNVHDCIIESYEPKAERGIKFEIILNSNNGFTNAKKIVFYDYIIKEKCNINKRFCIIDELYLKPNKRFEYHLLLQDFINGKENLSYFTINCSRIEVL